ncbi:serine endopeptidase [Burkholderiaceae bacterium DAT-1]|nr:serine endopeptidase [Burkholderiaceae bacterium DAT-1]
MSKALRLSEKWFQRGLWLVAIVFAGFLNGLGSNIVSDLPKVDPGVSLESFMPAGPTQAARAAIREAEKQTVAANEALAQAQLKRQTAQADVSAKRETFSNWLATRHVTEQSSQDPEVIKRTQELDVLKATERTTQARVESQQQILLDATQAQDHARRQLAELEDVARVQWYTAKRHQELRVFLYRLALTLPLLIIAGWLFRNKRKSPSWPFAWGFILFALSAFFIELVPYLPSYGGYVHYIVGIIVTVLIGRSSINALQRYLEQQKAAESQPDVVRRQELSYDTALARMTKGVCPGCERAVDLKHPHIDFCPHCGIGLFNHCTHCDTRKNAFSHFCHACGTAASGARSDSPSA